MICALAGKKVNQPPERDLAAGRTFVNNFLCVWVGAGVCEMRSVSVLVLLTAAAGSAAGVLFLPEYGEPDATTPFATVLSTSSSPSVGAVQAARVLSAHAPLYGAVGSAGDEKRKTDGTTRTVQLMKPTEITSEPTSPPSREQTVRGLTSDLQRELKRVGCFTSDVTGEWDAATRRAMRTFLDRVNARLPVQQPDHVLLTMVKGHPNDACAKNCPTGQVADDRGECAPRVIVSKVAPRDSAKSAAVVTEKVAPQVVTGSLAPSPSAPNRATQASSWTTELTPTVVDTQPLPRVAAERSAALPGRMSLGSAAPTSVDVVPSPSVTIVPAPRASGVPIKRARTAAATTDTPGASDAPTTAPVSLPTESDALVAPRPKAQSRPQAIDRPGATSRRQSSQASSFIPPAIRPAPRRDWKSAVFDQTSR